MPNACFYAAEQHLDLYKPFSQCKTNNRQSPHVTGSVYFKHRAGSSKRLRGDY